MTQLQQFLDRRAPGHTPWSTPRKEADAPEFLSGLVDGRTCGAPIAAIIRNTNTRSGDYSNLHDCPRPGHADFTAQVKYDGYQDVAGGGHFSGRLTAPICIAGGLCKQWLKEMGIEITAHIASIAGIADAPFHPLQPQHTQVGQCFPTLDAVAGEKMQEAILLAHKEGDSVGGIIECAVTGLPVGIGDPMFGGMEGRIAQIIYGIPAVKGVEFGAGFRVAEMRGSENNDSYDIQDGNVMTTTNHCGGILGGITNGMPLLFRTAIKPTPSIYKQQQSISIQKMETVPLQIHGRHDPCIVPRAVPVMEAAAAIAIYDAILSQSPKYRRPY
jgi:chorismate synthase